MAWPATATNPFQIGNPTAKGKFDLIWDALQFLSAGAANAKLFSNAAGNAPEFATGMKILPFTRLSDAASGDVAYTGVGFKPSYIIFIVNLPDSATGSIGFDNGTAHVCIANEHLSSANLWYSTQSYSIYQIFSTTQLQAAVVKTCDADGFTLTWTKGGSPGSATINGYALCIR